MARVRVIPPEYSSRHYGATHRIIQSIHALEVKLPFLLLGAEERNACKDTIGIVYVCPFRNKSLRLDRRGRKVRVAKAA